MMLVAALSSCMPDPLETEINPEQDKLVINSAFTATGTLWVSVTNSNGLIQSDKKGLQQLKDICVNDAVVTVSYNGRCDTLKLERLGFYTSEKFQGTPGITYVLKAVQKSTGKMVLAKSIIPAPPVDIRYRAKRLKEFGDSALKITLTFRSSEKANAYFMSYIQPVKASKTDSWNTKLNPLLQELFKAQNAVTLYSTEQQQHGVIEVHSYFPHTYLHDTIQVMIAGIEKGYYQFLDLQKKSGTLFNRSVGDPIRFYGNVQNGYGYFSLHLPEYVTIPPSEIEK